MHGKFFSNILDTSNTNIHACLSEMFKKEAGLKWWTLKFMNVKEIIYCNLQISWYII